MDYEGIQMQWAEWPKDVPRPTAEEYAVAEKRFRDENERFRLQAEKEGRPPYMGDCGYSLSFDMATCSIGTWWHYFFPDEPNRFLYHWLK